MTPTAFRQAIAALGYTQRGFAAFVGSNQRTVRRWAEGAQDIPAWVPVMLGLMASQRATQPPEDVSGVFSPNDPF